MEWVNLAAWVLAGGCALGGGYCLNGRLGLFTAGLVFFGASFVFTSAVLADKP